jgi:hypothetical protein
MQPPQLLQETERAAGSSQMLDQHHQLIEMKRELKTNQLVN